MKRQVGSIEDDGVFAHSRIVFFSEVCLPLAIEGVQGRSVRQEMRVSRLVLNGRADNDSKVSWRGAFRLDLSLNLSLEHGKQNLKSVGTGWKQQHAYPYNDD